MRSPDGATELTDVADGNTAAKADLDEAQPLLANPLGAYPSRDASCWAALFSIAVASTLYMLASSTAILLNRHILVDLAAPFPVTMTWLGLFTTMVFSTIVTYTCVPHSQRKGVTVQYYLTHMMPCGFFMAVAFLTGNMSFSYLTLALVQMLKASGPTITMLVLFALQLEQATYSLIASVCIVSLGVCLAAFGEVRMSFLGLILMMTSVVAESFRVVLMQYVMDPRGGDLHPVESIMYISSSCVAWLLPQALFWEWRKVWTLHAWTAVMDQPVPFMTYAVAGFGVSLLATWVVKLASSLTLKVLGTLKDAALVMLSVVLLNEHVTGLQLLGYSVSLVGFLLYNVAKARNVQQLAGAKIGYNHR